jgi:hypothetical protein
MLPLLIPIAIGAIAGAMSNKDKPLKGAMIGGAMGAGGGLLGGAALAGGAGAGAAGAAGAGAAGAGAGSGVGFGLGQSLATGTAGSATMAGGSAAAPSAGLLGTFGQQAGQFATNAKPFMDAASTGISAAGLLGGGQGQQQSPQLQPLSNTGAQTLAQIAQGSQDPLLARRQQMAAQHRTMWG